MHGSFHENQELSFTYTSSGELVEKNLTVSYGKRVFTVIKVFKRDDGQVFVALRNQNGEHYTVRPSDLNLEAPTIF